MDSSSQSSTRSSSADIPEIVAVLNLHALLCDERIWDRFDEVFTADASAYTAAGQGVDAIVELTRRHLGGCGPSQHLLGNHQIEVDGDSAQSRCRVRVMHQGAGERAHLTHEILGYYHDDLQRTSAGWRISTRVLESRMSFGDSSVLQPG